MSRTTKIIKAIIMTLIVVAGVIYISEMIITFLTVSKTLLGGGEVTPYTDVAKFFMRQTATVKMLLLLAAEIMIPGTIIGVVGFIVMIAKKVKTDTPEVMEEYEANK